MMPSTTDPLSALPSSPECIHQNLLILEASLRSQYLSLRARLRLYLILLLALCAWLTTFTYLLFLRPREDGKGAGGSPYWVVDMAEKLGWVGGVVTAGLVWATGMWDRGVRWPRRWVSVTNRGLRGFNLKLVVIRKHWWQELFSYLSVLDLLSGRVRGMRFEFLPKDIEKHTSVERGDKERARLWETGGRDGWVEEDVAPGGDSVKLLLLPKPFSPDFRADWETHRTTYWEKENERRKQLRGIMRLRARQLARQEGGWLWWTGWRGRNTFSLARRPTIIGNNSSGGKKPELVRSRASHGSHNSLSSKGSHGQLKREKRRDRTPPKGFLKSRSSNTPLTTRVLNAEAST